MNAIISTILFPFAGAFLVAALPKKYKAASAVTVLGLGLLSCVLAALKVAAQKEILFQRSVTSWFSIAFVGDGLSVFMAGVSLFVATLIALYSIEYMKEYEAKADFYFWMVLFVGAMMGLVFSANLLLMYCFWEITAVCSWRLIGFHRREKDTKAADRAFLTTFAGASALLAGIVLVYLQYGTLDIISLRGQPLPEIIAWLFLAGIVSKSAQLPLQTWLPDAGVAPTPVTALLHAAVLVKIGVYVFARLFCLTFPIPIGFVNLAVFVSLATIIVGGGCALVENNIKRILAYSTISQLGYVILAFCLFNNVALKIGLLYILAHSLAKAGLFLCAGIVEHKTGTKDINELGGLIKRMPYTALGFLLCAFSIIGIPPFLGFWPKFMVIVETANDGRILAAALAVLGALFTLFYLMRMFHTVFLGEEKNTAPEEGGYMVYVVLILGVLSLLLGLGVKLPLNLLSALMG